MLNNLIQAARRGVNTAASQVGQPAPSTVAGPVGSAARRMPSAQGLDLLMKGTADMQNLGNSMRKPIETGRFAGRGRAVPRIFPKKQTTMANAPALRPMPRMSPQMRQVMTGRNSAAL